MIKLTFKIGEKEISLTLEEARSLYAELKSLFGTEPHDPFEKWRTPFDWTKPWHPSTDWPDPWTPYTPIYGPNQTATAPKPGPREIIWLKGDTKQ